MGKRGPARLPLKMHKARGGWRGKERTEPELQSGAPKPPADLTELEAQTWREVCELLAPVGVVTLGDGLALRMLVDAYRAWRLARDAGDEVQVRFARGEVLRWLGRFGLTPADRTNVGGGAAKSGNTKERFFKVHG